MSLQLKIKKTDNENTGSLKQEHNSYKMVDLMSAETTRKETTTTLELALRNASLTTNETI